MILSPDQIEKLLNIFSNQFAMFVASTHGGNYLTSDQKKSLVGLGVDWENLYDKSKDPSWTSFQLGLLAEAAGDDKIKNLTFKELQKGITAGDHIHLTKKEQDIVDSIKMKSLTSIKAMQNKIENDLNNILDEQNAKTSKEIQGKEASINEAVYSLAQKIKGWSNDFNKSVEYISHSALNEGKVAMIKRVSPNSKIYFIVQDGACKNCIEHYLTHGWGSQPVLFSIDEIEVNGSNIGKKVIDWLPTIHSLHPHCRCLVQKLQEGYVWDKDKGDFVAPDFKPKTGIDFSKFVKKNKS